MKVHLSSKQVISTAAENSHVMQCINTRTYAKKKNLVQPASWPLRLMQPLQLTMEHIGCHSRAETSNTCMYSGQSQRRNASRKCHFMYVDYCIHCILALRSQRASEQRCEAAARQQMITACCRVQINFRTFTFNAAGYSLWLLF